MPTPEEFKIPEKCPSCNSTKFATLSNGDVVCENCKTVIGKWFEYIREQEY